MQKEIIILTSADYDNYPNSKGILTFENKNNGTYINTKFFNLDLSHKKVLGVKQNNNLYKIEILQQQEVVKVPQNLDLTQKISCVVLNNFGNVASPVIWGSNETNNVWKTSFLSLNDENNMVDDEVLNQKVSKVLQVETKEIDTEEDIEKIIDKELEKEENKELLINDSNKKEFFDSIKEQVEELLNLYDDEENLEMIIPNSKFVKVEDDEDFYIFGVMYDDSGNIKYLVYGHKSQFGKLPNDEFKNNYQWVPLLEEEPEGVGYYLMYQDAFDGSSININFV